MSHEAIYNLYPNVVSINGPSNAMDANGDLVAINMTAVNQEADRMEAEAIAKEEAREAIRASALQKLVENAGLTVEEVEEFLKVDL
jgi:hypothetical protein